MTWHWVAEYNEARSHDSLGDLTPSEYPIDHTGDSTSDWST